MEKASALCLAAEAEALLYFAQNTLGPGRIYQTPTKTAPNLLQYGKFGAVCISGHLPADYQ